MGINSTKAVFTGRKINAFSVDIHFLIMEILTGNSIEKIIILRVINEVNKIHLKAIFMVILKYNLLKIMTFA